MKRWPIVINGLLTVVTPALAVSSPSGHGPVAVFTAPWLAGSAQVVARAGGKLVSAGRWPWIITAVSDDPGFVRRLYWSGAILVADPRLAVGCADEFNVRQVS